MTQCFVNEAREREKLELQSLPSASFRALLKLERRISHDGRVSISGKFIALQIGSAESSKFTLPDQFRIPDEGVAVATRFVLEERRQYRINPPH